MLLLETELVVHFIEQFFYHYPEGQENHLLSFTLFSTSLVVTQLCELQNTKADSEKIFHDILLTSS